ncbi:AAA family ATPase [Nostoc sp. ChiQUE01b]|uniref:AAA family ATPase n=1 Tax=Nostoc sp. ChiQUE01b TaxID=3075376 RepID=UPI002AD258AC|nr:AAA family ATPase [Nostoc sp. ChiQUE01b]MDZ8259410.1 AAA family ATPase [Nostoc sp. ChiQUE01b]
MKINKITYYDHELEWQFEPIHFSELNLLVGISGVGKTQILTSIMNLRKIARGGSLNSVEWDIDFSSNNYEYKWNGEFENKKVDAFILDDEKAEKNKFRINREHLSINAKVIIERNNHEIVFYGNKLPKLSLFESAVKILSEEEDIAPVKDGFNKVIYSDQSRGENYVLVYDMIHYLIIPNRASSKKYSSLEEIQESNLPTKIKLALVYNHYPQTFQEIKQRFIDIFDQVEDIRMEPDKDLHKIIADYPFINIKEKGVNNWITEERISSGMFRTLMHISELYLSAEGTVILIDEFENSLGVNCIDILSDLLLENRKLQFIITSHHHYIINKIGIEHWKIVTRRGGVVTVKNAKDYNLGKSRHQAFMQLINLDAYKEGIAAG